MGVATSVAPEGLGSQNPVKKLVHSMYLVGQLLSQNNVSTIFKPEPPPPPKNKLRVNPHKIMWYRNIYRSTMNHYFLQIFKCNNFPDKFLAMDHFN